MNFAVDLLSVPRASPPLCLRARSREVDEGDLLRAVSRGPVPILLLDRDLRLVFANDAAAGALRLSRPALIGGSLAELLPHTAALARHAMELLDRGRPTLECEIGHAGRHYQVSVNPLRTAGQVEGMIVAATDITRRHRATRQLRAAARRLAARTRCDHLTQLMNRRGLDLALRQKTKSASRMREPLSVLMADIDWFKSYNDEYGHLAGDHCIRRIAKCLRTCVESAGGEAARYGGEEFVAVLPGISRADATSIAERFRAEVEALEIAHGFSLYEVVTVSVGAASLGPAITDLPTDWYREGILSAADDALYCAKADGRNRVRSFGWRL